METRPPVKLLPRECFDIYEGIRLSGMVNMLNLRRYSSLTGMSREEILFLIENYTAHKRAYGSVVPR